MQKCKKLYRGLDMRILTCYNASGYSEVGIAPGLGPGDRAFESHYSDQRKRDSEITDFRAPFSCSMSTARLDPNPSKSTGLGSSPGQIQEHHVLLHSTSERH